jgi:hypothetical protein
MKLLIIYAFSIGSILIITLESAICQSAETRSLHNHRGNQHPVNGLFADRLSSISRQTTDSIIESSRNNAQQSNSCSHLTSGTKNMNSTGIEGKVTIGPISPIERSEVANERPYEATITVLDRAGIVVDQIKSDTSGHFRLKLSPGQYTLRPESLGSHPYAREQIVTVTEIGFTSVQIQYDSGIR